MYQTAVLAGKVWIYNDIDYKDELNIFWVVTPCILTDTDISEEHSASNFNKRIIYSSTLKAEVARFF